MEKTICIYYFLDQNRIPFYVGLTTNLKQRINSHLFEINHNNMLPCYTKARKIIKEHALDFEKDIVACVEICREDELEEKEIFHIKLLRESGHKLKNLTSGGRGSIGFTDEINKRSGKSRKGIKRSEETKRKTSEALKGKPKSEEHKKALKLARNKRPSASIETRKKMSLSSKGKINIKIFKLVDPNGNVFITNEGLTKFCEEHGLHAANLHKVMKGERLDHKGWTAYPLDI